MTAAVIGQIVEAMQRFAALDLENFNRLNILLQRIVEHFSENVQSRGNLFDTKSSQVRLPSPIATSTIHHRLSPSSATFSSRKFFSDSSQWFTWHELPVALRFAAGQDITELHLPPLPLIIPQVPPCETSSYSSDAR